MGNEVDFPQGYRFTPRDQLMSTVAGGQDDPWPHNIPSAARRSQSICWDSMGCLSALVRAHPFTAWDRLTLVRQLLAIQATSCGSPKAREEGA